MTSCGVTRESAACVLVLRPLFRHSREHLVRCGIGRGLLCRVRCGDSESVDCARQAGVVVFFTALALVGLWGQLRNRLRQTRPLDGKHTLPFRRGEW